MDFLFVFTETLRELMSERDLNVSNFAKKIGCDVKAVSRWLNRVYYPSSESLFKIADCFGCSIDYLFGLTDRYRSQPVSDASDFLSRYELLKSKAGLKDAAVARFCGIGKPAVSKWRRNGNIPETRTLLKLCELFCTDLEYLLGRGGKRFVDSL